MNPVNKRLLLALLAQMYIDTKDTREKNLWARLHYAIDKDKMNDDEKLLTKSLIKKTIEKLKEKLALPIAEDAKTRLRFILENYEQIEGTLNVSATPTASE